MRRLSLALPLLLVACSKGKDDAPPPKGTDDAPSPKAAGDSADAARPPRTGRFEVKNEVLIKVPPGAKKVRVWFAVPQDDDPAQKVTGLKVEAPFPHRLEKDDQGNTVGYLEATAPTQPEFSVVTTFELTRHEVRSGASPDKTRPLTNAERSERERYLQPSTNVVINDKIKALAERVAGDEKNPVALARKLYDWELENIDYWVKDPANKKASPVGSTTYCLDTGTGNCTDFHSLWSSLAMASGLPTRLVYGSFLKKELDSQDADQSYHCWPEFFAPGLGWVPHDVAVADIFHKEFPLTDENNKLVRLTTADGFTGPDPAKVDYYFGNIDERRVVWSRGRDLVLTPKPANSPVNAMAKAHVEVDDKVHPEKDGWVRKLTYREIGTAAQAEK